MLGTDKTSTDLSAAYWFQSTFSAAFRKSAVPGRNAIQNKEKLSYTIVRCSGVNEPTWWHDRRLTLLGIVEPTFSGKPTIHDRSDGPVIGPAFA
jgi:hypothetical protein